MKFYSSALQATFDKVQTVLDSYHVLKQNIMADVHQLELLLKKVARNVNCTFKMHRSNVPRHHEELLVWDADQQKIIYIKNAYQALCIEKEQTYTQHVNYNRKEILIEQPLKDTDFDVVRQIWEQDILANFLSYVTHEHC